MDKSSQIQKVRLEHIKILLKRENIDQKDLAAQIDMEAQNFSRIMTKGTVTERTCRKIYKAYPQYRLSWLLGDSDHMTIDEYMGSQFAKDKRYDTAVYNTLACALDRVCEYENIKEPRALNDDFDDYLLLSAQLKDYAEYIVSNYLKNNAHSYLWSLRKSKPIKVRRVSASDNKE